MTNKQGPSIYFVFLLCIFCFFSILSVFQACSNALRQSQDFSSRWASAKLILHGENPYQMSLEKTSSEYSNQILKNKRVFFDPQYLPSSLLFIYPFAVLPFDLAAQLFLVANLFFAGLLIYGLFIIIKSKLDSKLDYLFVVMIFLCGTPFRTTLGLGQLSIISLTLFGLALHFDDKKQWIKAGIFLSLSLLKYHLTLPFLLFFFILEKRWRSLIVSGIIHCIAHLWLCYVIKAPVLKIFSDLWQLNKKQLLAPGVDIYSVLKRMDGVILSQESLNHIVLIVLLSVFMMTVFLWIKRKDRVDLIGRLSIAGVFALFSTYHRIYDFVSLFFPLLWIFTFQQNKELRTMIGISIFYAFIINRIMDEMSLKGWPLFAKADEVLFAIAFYTVFAMTYVLIYFKGFRETPRDLS
jgi:hypothetical protein